MGCNSSRGVASPDRPALKRLASSHAQPGFDDGPTDAEANLLQGVAHLSPPPDSGEHMATSSSAGGVLQWLEEGEESQQQADAFASPAGKKAGSTKAKLTRRGSNLEADPEEFAEENERGILSAEDALKDHPHAGGDQQLKPLCPPWTGTYVVPRGHSAELRIGVTSGGSSSSSSAPSTSAGATSPSTSGKTWSNAGGSPWSGGTPASGYVKPLPNVADIVVASQRPAAVPFSDRPSRKDACPTPWSSSLAECGDCDRECDSVWARYCVARPADGDPSDTTRSTKASQKAPRV